MPFQLRLNYTIHNKLQYMRHSVAITDMSHMFCMCTVFCFLCIVFRSALSARTVTL